MKRIVVLTLALLMALGAASPAGAVTLRKLNRSPFYGPGLGSEAAVRKMVKERDADLKAGFEKTGAPDLYALFTEGFPTARITAVTVAPGETFSWMLFKRKKGRGKVAVLKDVTWGGDASFDAYRLEFDARGKRYDAPPRSLPLRPHPLRGSPVCCSTAGCPASLTPPVTRSPG